MKLKDKKLPTFQCDANESRYLKARMHQFSAQYNLRVILCCAREATTDRLPDSLAGEEEVPSKPHKLG